MNDTPALSAETLIERAREAAEDMRWLSDRDAFHDAGLREDHDPSGAAQIIDDLLAARSDHQPTGEVEERLIEAVINADQFGYSLNLTRLVDGVSTYTLSIPGEPDQTFDDIDDAYLRIADLRAARRRQAVRATIEHQAQELERLRGALELDEAAREWVEIDNLTSPPCTAEMLKTSDRRLFKAVREYVAHLEVKSNG